MSFPADLLLRQLNQHRPGVPVVGGMASGAMHAGQNRLLLGSREITRGAVAVLVHGAIRLITVVSQGCRPIGRPLVVTKAQGNAILQLGGQPAFEQLQAIYGELSPDEQQLARRGLHVGQVINEYQEQFGRGDFLVRNVQGADPATGAIAIGDVVRVGQTVQFHVRDAATADEDLNALLASTKENSKADCLGLCCSRAMAAANDCSTSRIMMPARSASSGTISRWRVFLLKAKLAQLAVGTFCTDSRPVSC